MYCFFQVVSFQKCHQSLTHFNCVRFLRFDINLGACKWLGCQYISIFPGIIGTGITFNVIYIAIYKVPFHSYEITSKDSCQTSWQSKHMLDIYVQHTLANTMTFNTVVVLCSNNNKCYLQHNITMLRSTANFCIYIYRQIIFRDKESK